MVFLEVRDELSGHRRACAEPPERGVGNDARQRDVEGNADINERHRRTRSRIGAGCAAEGVVERTKVSGGWKPSA